MEASPLTLHLFGADITAEESWRLLDWCWSRGADEFTIRQLYTGRDRNPPFLEAFDSALGQFGRPAGHRRTLELYRGQDRLQQVPLWELCPASIAALGSFLPNGLFSCYEPPDAWLEDPIVYRQAQFMLGVTSHEREGILRIHRDERDLVAGLGITVRERGQWVTY